MMMKASCCTRCMLIADHGTQGMREVVLDIYKAVSWLADYDCGC